MDLFKVFICEDESIVREGLRDMIPWEKYGFEFVGDAPDGEMALPMIRKLKPDVLITDITMPFMDGLSLSKTVTKELPNIKIIVISGYSDFEYARKAIEIGVEQYLLKPVTKTDMINALEGVRKKITEENEQKDYVKLYEQEFKKFERLSHRVFFEKLVEGSLSVQEIYEEADKLHLNLSADGYNIVIFSIRDLDQSTYSDEASGVTENLLNQFLQYPDYIIFRCNLFSYAVLIKGDEESLKRMEEKCVKMIGQHCEQASATLDWHVAVGVATNRLSGLSSCYQDANRAFAYRHIFPNQHIFTSEQIKTEQFVASDDEIGQIDAGKFDPMIIRYFVQTGTGVYRQYRPVEGKCAKQCEWNGGPPHADSKAVHIKDRIASSIHNAVDRNGIHASSDHVENHNNHHAGQVAMGFLGQNHRGSHQGRQCKDDSGGSKAAAIFGILQIEKRLYLQHSLAQTDHIVLHGITSPFQIIFISASY